MGPRSHPPRSLTFPGAPQRVHWCFLALTSARRKVLTRSLALSRARPRSLARPGVLPALPGAPWRSLALPGGRPGPLPPRDPLPGSPWGGLQGGYALDYDTTRNRSESESERERREERKRKGTAKKAEAKTR